MTIIHDFSSINLSRDYVWNIKCFIIASFIASIFISACFLFFFSRSVYYAFIWYINLIFVILLFVFSAFVMKEYFLIGVGMLFLALFAAGVLIWLRRKINLVARIFAEAAKVLFDVKCLFLLPLMVSIYWVVKFHEIISTFLNFCRSRHSQHSSLHHQFSSSSS